MSEVRAVRDAGLSGAERAALDDVVERLAAQRTEWVSVGLRERIDLLRGCTRGVLASADAWVSETCVHQGIDPGSPLSGEIWISGPMVTVEALRQYRRALRQGGQPRPRRIRSRANGQIVADVFPKTPDEHFLYHNMRVEVWIEPGRPESQGRIYREKATGIRREGRVALVLGAGNISSIGPLDALYKMFVEDQVVLLKMHPVNEYLGPVFERAFEPLIRGGYLAIVHGGTAAGAYLCQHPRIDTIHLTGSDRTHDAIVWGADPGEQETRKRAGTPVLDKEVTSELGCVTPILVVPGDWSRSDIAFQAKHVASMVAHNGSFNCTAGKVLVTARGWPGRDQFLAGVREALAATPPRRAYYPGAAERYRRFRDRYPSAIAVGREGNGAIPWTVIPDVPPVSGEYALSNEAFCGVLAETAIDAGNAADFLTRAVPLCNETIWGTLSCVILIDRATRRRNQHALERAIADLRYGSIGVNAWTGVNYALSCASWGAFPGHTREKIVSGRGVVHNAMMFDHPEKSVVMSHFRIRPKPIWFADHRSLDTLGRHLTIFMARGSPWALLRVALAGLRG